MFQNLAWKFYLQFSTKHRSIIFQADPLVGLLYIENKKTREYVLYTEFAPVDKKYPKVLKKLSTTYQQLWIIKWAF